MLSVVLRNPFLLLLIPLVLGIHFYTTWGSSFPDIWLMILLVFLTTAFTILHLIKNTTQAIQTGRIAIVVISFFLLGSLSAYVQDVKNNKQWYGHSIEQSQAYKVRLLDMPLKKEKSWVLHVSMLASIQENAAFAVSGESYVYVFSQDTVFPYRQGDEIIVQNKFTNIANSGNPFGFDYADYCSKKGIYHQAFLSLGDVILYRKSSGRQDLFSLVKSSVNKSIALNIHDPATSGLMQAIMLNERALLHDDIWKTYSTTGIVHIIAISGMHVSLLFNLLLYSFFWLKTKNREWLKYAIALPIVWFYVMLTDNPASAVRAAVMFTIIALSVFIKHEQRPVNSWAAAAFFMLFVQPYWLYDVGMQLSFLCILSIILFYNPVYRSVYFKNRLTDKLWKGIAASLAVQILVAPLVIYYFHQFPVWVVIANIPAGIYSLILMYGTIAIAILSPLGFNCIWLGELLSWCTHWFNIFIALLSRFSPQNFMQLSIDAFDFWLMMLAIVLISIFTSEQKTIYLKSGILSFAVMFLAFIIKDYRAMDSNRLIVYNINGLGCADLMVGKKYYPIQYNEANISHKVQSGILNPARIGYRATDSGSLMQLNNVVRIDNKTILFLNEEIINCNIKADIIVVSNMVKIIDEAIQCTKADLIVLDGTVNRANAYRWKKELAMKGKTVYAVTTDGAWVLND